jgi:hypothetical protein
MFNPLNFTIMKISSCFTLSTVGEKTEIKSSKGYGLLAICRGALHEERCRIRKNPDKTFSYLSSFSIDKLNNIHF